MDPTYEEEEDETAAMAAAMGFSSFGSHKPPAKKRKFNAATDAFVDGQELAKLDKGGKKGQGSGGNTMPLGKMRVLGTGGINKASEGEGVRNQEEIDLDEDEEQEGPQYEDTSLPPPIEEPYDYGPQYVDTSEPPPAASDEEAKEMQSRIDAILASVESGERATTDVQRPHGLPQRPTFIPPSNDTELVQSGLSSSPDNSRHGFGRSMSLASPRSGHHPRGQRNENWYLDYYDPTFNENPWARLEKEKGLPPLGKWPEIQRSGKPT
jgi:hypothetical protein